MITKPQVPLIEIYLIGVIGIVVGFLFVWQNETVINKAAIEWSKQDYVIGSVAIYLSVFAVLFSIADLIRQLVIKARN